MKKTTDWEKIENKSYSFLANMTTFYIIFISVFLPLYYEKKYADIGFAKYNIFYYITWVFPIKRIHISLPGFFPFMLIGLIIYLVSLYFQRKKIQFNKTDLCLIIYAVFVIISAIFAEDKTYVVNGYPGWHMGLIAQLSFVFIYFFISGFLPDENRVLPFVNITAIIVFILEILNRFYIDPLGMIAPLLDVSKNDFVSTIGNINWFCGYLMIIFPIWMYQFYTSSNNKKLFTGVFLSIGSMSLITQGSAGGLLAFLAVSAFMFYDALSSKEKLLRFLEMIIVILVSWRIIGILRLLYPHEVVKLDGIFESLMTSITVLIFTGIVILGYLYLKKKEVLDYNPLSLQKGYLYLTLLIVILPILYVILNSLNMLPESISSDNTYLKFDEDWGTGRGIIMQTAVNTIIKQPVWRFFIGNGPDECRYVLYKYDPKDITMYWGDHYVVTAHNEFLTSLINYGIIGAVSYFLAFLSEAKKNIKKDKNEAYALAIISYLVYGLISFQTILNGTFIFLILGIVRKHYQ